jgi:hypothetical protein
MALMVERNMTGHDWVEPDAHEIFKESVWRCLNRLPENRDNPIHGIRQCNVVVEPCENVERSRFSDLANLLVRNDE